MGHGEGEKFDRFSPVYTALPIRILPLRSSLEGGGGEGEISSSSLSKINIVPRSYRGDCLLKF